MSKTVHWSWLRMSAAATGLLGLTVVALAILGLGSGGATRVAAEPAGALSLGYYDQNETTFLSIELGDDNPDVGAFYVAVPGVGVFWAATPLGVTEEIDGSLTLTFSGSGYLDTAAAFETSGVFRMEPSGAADEVEFTVTGTITEDLGTAAMTLTYDSTPYSLASEPAPETAENVADDLAELLAQADFSSVRLMYIDGFIEDVDDTTFVELMEGYFGLHSAVSAATVNGSVIYEPNPGSGAQLAHASIAVTFGTGLGAETLHMPATFLYRENAWQILGLDSFVEERSLTLVSSPGLEVAGELFDIQPTIVVLDNRGLPAKSDDSTEVTLSIGDGPPGAVLTCSGGLAAAAEDGLVEFAGCQLDLPGTYTIIATATEAGSVESEPFNVIEMEGVLIADDDPVTLTTLVPSDSVKFVFGATGIDDYSIVIDSLDVEEGEFYLRTPGSASVVVSGPIQAGHGYVEFPQESLPDDTYWLFVRGIDEAVGSFTASLHTFVDVTDTISADGDPHPLVTADPGSNARFDFSVSAGKSLVASLTFSASGSAGYMALFDDSDNVVGELYWGDSAGMLYSRPLLAGDYHVLVDPWDSTVGTVTITPTLIADAGVSGSIDTPELATISTSGQNFRLHFSGTASTVVAVDLSSSDFSLLTVYLVDSTGAELSWGQTELEDDRVFAFELPATDDYDVWIVPGSGETGSVTVEVVDITP